MQMVWVICWLLTVLFIGFRHEVGTDWPNYMAIWDAQGDSFISVLLHFELFYYILMYLVKGMGLTIHWLNLLTSFIAITPIFYYSYHQKNKWLALTSLVTVLFIITYMGYARQAPAIGLTIWAMFKFLDEKFISSFSILIAASLFHNSATLLIFIFAGFVFMQARPRYKLFVLALSSILLISQGDYLISRLLKLFDLGLISLGALPRIALVDIALIAAIIFRKKLFMSRFQRDFILYYSCCGLVASGLVFVNGVIADRVILYWLVIQIIVYGNISTITNNNNTRVFVLMSVVALNLCTLLVWLVFGTFSSDWIPYMNFLFI